MAAANGWRSERGVQEHSEKREYEDDERPGPVICSPSVSCQVNEGEDIQDDHAYHRRAPCDVVRRRNGDLRGVLRKRGGGKWENGHC